MLSGGDHPALPSLAENFFDCLPAAVYVCDTAGSIRYCNRRAAALWGRTPTSGDTEQRFWGAFRLFYADGTLMPQASTPMADALRMGLPQHNIEAMIERPDGSRTTIMINIEVIRDETGALSGAVNVFQDITDRKRIERRLTAQLGITQLLAHAADFSAAAPRLLQTTCEHLDWDVGLLWIVEPQTNVLRCAEVWHRPSLQIPEFAATSRHRTFASGVGLPGRVWASGEPVWIPDTITDTNFPRALMAAKDGLHSGFGFPILLGQELLGVMEFFSVERREPDAPLLQMMAGIGSQIGQFLDRKDAEAQLRRSEQELADFFNNAAVGLHWVGPDGVVLRVNQAELALLGYAREEYVGHHIAEFHADQHVIEDIVRRLQAGEELHDYAARLVCKDGSLKHVLIDSNVFWEHGQFRHTRCFTRDITAQKWAEEDLRHLNETLVQRVAAGTMEISQANATLQEEILQHKQAREQLEQQQEALAQREKLAAMGSMLASVAHELNNPLAVVMMQAEILREEAGSGPLAAHAAEMLQAAGRCVEIVHNFLSLARQHPPKRTQVALHEVIQEAMKLLAYPLRVDTIAVEQHLAKELPVLWADPHQLQQVVVNLLTNAHQALRETTGPRQLTIRTHVDRAHKRAVLEVADTGPGILPAVRERIFEPFFTTKPPGVGTGLGLSFCLGIIEGHGGTIDVDSMLGRGTLVRVELPIEPVPADGLTSEPTVMPTARGKTILIVDDEPGITRSLARLLQRDGHVVETAANGRLALEKCRERDYELLLCDLRMPELDGPGFYQELQRRHAHLCQRIIFLTGDTLSPEAQTFLEHTGVPRLNKPFTAAMIRQAIQRF